MPSRQRVLTGAVLSLALLAAACSSPDGDPEGGPENGPGPGPESSSQTATPGAEPSTDPDADPDPDPDQGYLPVPDGVTLTDPGTRLGLGDAAVGAWLPRQDLVGVVEVAVTRIDETTVQASLAGFDLDAQAQRSTPYFVRTRVTNVGETELGTRQVPLYLLDSRGTYLAPTGVASDFAPCPGSVLPEDFAPGDTVKSCLIFLAPEGSTVQSIRFTLPEGVDPLQWNGPVRTDAEKRSGAGSEKGDRKSPKSGRKGLRGP